MRAASGRATINRLIAVQSQEFQKGMKVRMDMWLWDAPKEGVIEKIVVTPRKEFVFYLNVDGKRIGAFEKELTKI